MRYFVLCVADLGGSLGGAWRSHAAPAAAARDERLPRPAVGQGAGGHRAGRPLPGSREGRKESVRRQGVQPRRAATRGDALRRRHHQQGPHATADHPHGRQHPGHVLARHLRAQPIARVHPRLAQQPGRVQLRVRRPEDAAHALQLDRARGRRRRRFLQLRLASGQYPNFGTNIEK